MQKKGLLSKAVFQALTLSGTESRPRSSVFTRTPDLGRGNTGRSYAKKRIFLSKAIFQTLTLSDTGNMHRFSAFTRTSGFGRGNAGRSYAKKGASFKSSLSSSDTVGHWKHASVFCFHSHLRLRTRKRRQELRKKRGFFQKQSFKL